jgi:predicted amidohydrolase
MRITVCELNDQPEILALEWEQLAAHVAAEASELVLLPEMPFCSWFARTRPCEPVVWQAAVAAHDRWLARLGELSPAARVAGTRPVNNAMLERLNEGFVWERAGGYRGAHAKYYLPDEEGFWEASWYMRGDGQFAPIESGGVKMGFLICSELWFLERARAYGKAGVHLLLCPRGAELRTLEKWLVGGRTAAIVSGAFCLSSNRAGPNLPGAPFGGHGWVIGPDGQVLDLTSPEAPFLTLDIDLGEAERAKRTYPRYLAD